MNSTNISICKASSNNDCHYQVEITATTIIGIFKGVVELTFIVQQQLKDVIKEPKLGCIKDGSISTIKDALYNKNPNLNIGNIKFGKFVPSKQKKKQLNIEITALPNILIKLVLM